MSTPESVKNAIQAAIAAGNAKTGKSDTDLTAVVDSLIVAVDAAPTTPSGVQRGTIMMGASYGAPYVIPVSGTTEFFVIFRSEDIVSGNETECFAVIYTGSLAEYDLEIYGSYGAKISECVNKGILVSVSDGAISINPYAPIQPGVEYNWIAVSNIAEAGIQLPELTNPAAPQNVTAGMEYIDEQGRVQIGTSTADADLQAAEGDIATAIGAAENALEQIAGTYPTVTSAMGAMVTALLASNPSTPSAFECNSSKFTLGSNSFSSFSIAHGLSKPPKLFIMMHDEAVTITGQFHVGLFYIANPVNGEYLLASTLQADANLKFTPLGTGCIGTTYGYSSTSSRISADGTNVSINTCRLNWHSGQHTWYAFTW